MVNWYPHLVSRIWFYKLTLWQFWVFVTSNAAGLTTANKKLQLKLK